MTDRIIYRVRWEYRGQPRDDVYQTLAGALERAKELEADADVSQVEVVVETVVYRTGDGHE